MTYEYNLSLYKNRCLDLFKSIFKDQLKNNHQLVFEELESQCLSQMGLPHHEYLKSILKEWFDRIYHLSFIHSYLELSNLREIIIHSKNKLQVHTQKRETIILDELSGQELQYSLEVLASRFNQEWNHLKPFVSFQASIQGQLFRVSLCHYSTSAQGQSKAFFRRMTMESFALDDYLSSKDAEHLIRRLIQEQRNIVVCGATGSGKTSFIRSMLQEIPNDEHIITIEDTYELILDRDEHTSFISKDTEQNSMTSYCKYSLRMKPDRILVGEIRGAEIVPFLLSANSGHRGMITSLHANSTIDSLKRMALLFQIYSDQRGLSYEHVFQLICGGIDYIIQLKSRQVADIIRVIGSEGSTPYFERVFDTPQ